MSPHAGEDVIEGADGFSDVWALVQHDALGALSHGGVGDFGARGDAFLGEYVEHLSGPDDRQVGGFADPENFFLHFSQSLVAAFDGEVAAGDHDAKATDLHGFQEYRGQVFEGLAGLDFQNDGQRFGVDCAKMLMQLADIARCAHERVAKDVGMGGDEFEVFDIVCGKCRHGDAGAWKVDALGLAQPLACDPSLSDLDAEMRGCDRANQATNFAVIKPDSFAGFCVFEHGG